MYKGLKFFLKCGWKYDKLYIVWRILYQIVSSLIPIVMTIIPKFIIDEILGERDIKKILTYILLLTGYVAIASILSEYFSMDGFSRRCHVSAEFDSELHRKLANADFENLESPNFLDMQEKSKKFLYCDWHGFGYLFDCALNIVGQILTMIGIIAIIASLNIWIIMIFIIFSILGTVIEAKQKRKAMSLSLQITADQRGWQYYAQLFDDFNYGKEIRMNGVGEWLLSRERGYFTKVNKNLKEQNDTYIRAGIITNSFLFVEQTIAYIYLCWSVIEKTISIGSFTMYISAITTFSNSLRAILDSLVEIKAYDLYYDQLDSYLSVPAKLREGGNKEVPEGNHEIVFEHVGFKYEGSNVWALRDINLKIRPGEKIAIVGENGAGKSTFVKLLIRLYAPTTGKILMDGVDIKDIDYDKYMMLFSTVFQDFRLFSFSIKENVVLAMPQNEKKVKEVLKCVGLEKKIENLPEGIDTSVYKNFDEQGFEPSGGEAQKIALARALYRESPVVILDEPTAALDPKAELELYEQFNNFLKGKTGIYITHRLASAHFCDRIIVFENGQILEQGNQEELMNKKGRFFELFNMQARYYSKIEDENR